MKPQEIKDFLIGKGFVQDRFGHMKKEFPNRIRRYKFQKISLRVEVKRNAPNSKWLNEAYGTPIYYKGLQIVNGKLTKIK